MLCILIKFTFVYSGKVEVALFGDYVHQIQRLMVDGCSA